VEALVESIDKRLPLGEVHVEGSLGHARRGDDPVDTQPGQPLRGGDLGPRLEQQFARPMGRLGDHLWAIGRVYLTTWSVKMTDRSVA
jgi:hypothetical protein